MLVVPLIAFAVDRDPGLYLHAHDWEVVDLLGRRWLAPFASQALLMALLWLFVPALWAVNLLDSPFLLVVPAVTALCAVVGTAALLLPTRGVRGRLATRLRFGLYLALPLGSWLGGARVDWLVERLLA